MHVRKVRTRLTIHLLIFSSSSKEGKRKCSFPSQILREKGTKKGGEVPMSAFMVADTTINYVVNWLRREIDRLPIISHKLKYVGFDTGGSDWAERLGQAMFQLNIEAVNDRYGSSEAARFRKLDYRFEHTEAVSLMQVLKSLQCWLYQCNEGDVPTTELYGLLDTDVQMYLMDTIITKLPEYEEATWG
jgi:hypothetical protein